MVYNTHVSHAPASYNKTIYHVTYFKSGIQPKCAAQTERCKAQILEVWSDNACKVRWI